MSADFPPSLLCPPFAASFPSSTPLSTSPLCLQGRTALHYACQKNFEDIAELLLQRGANPNSSDYVSAIIARPGNLMPSFPTPVCLQAARLQPFRLRFPSELNTRLCGCLQEHITPLHLAAMSNAVDCVQILVRYGANVTLKSRANVTPEQVAEMAGNDEVAAYLSGDLSGERSPSVGVPSPLPAPVFDPISPPYQRRSPRLSSTSPTQQRSVRRISSAVEEAAAPAPARSSSRPGSSHSGDVLHSVAQDYASSATRSKGRGASAGATSAPPTASRRQAKPPLPLPAASTSSMSTSKPMMISSAHKGRGGGLTTPVATSAGPPPSVSRSMTFDNPAFSRESSPHRLSVPIRPLGPEHDLVALPQQLGEESERVRERVNTMWAKQRINEKSKAEAIKEVGRDGARVLVDVSSPQEGP